MADALRAAKALPEFFAALSVHLVEISPALRALQEKALVNAGVPTAWHHGVDDIPDGPAIAIANEFVDALPVSQFVKDRDGWHVRMVGVAGGRLSFLAAPDPMPGVPATDAPPGTILERRHDGPLALLARRVAHGGAALFIDYGHAETGFGDTLQAVREHKFADPLDDAGRGGPHHASRFRARSHTPHKSRARPLKGPMHAGRIPAPARHRAARGPAQGECDARNRLPTSTPRSRASPRRTRWANCSRCWRSPILGLARCRDLTCKCSAVIPGRRKPAKSERQQHDPGPVPRRRKTSATRSSRARAAYRTASTQASMAASARAMRPTE